MLKKSSLMKIRNIELNVSDQGEGNALVWAHGLMGSMAAEDGWDILKWELQKEHFHFIRYDARGHGESEGTKSPEDYHWRSLAKDMVGIIKAKGLEKAIAGGMSMGCATAIYAGVQDPDKLNGLILMNPPTAWETRTEQGKLYNRFAWAGRILGGSLLGKIIARNPSRLLPGWIVESGTVDMGEAFNALGKISRSTLFNLLKGAALTDLPPREEIRKIKLPTLILAWTNDQSHPVETAEKLHDDIQNSELHVASSMEELDTWPELIRKFVESHG
ncbi:MAG: alpha/beta fold hydrolase [Candidatus Thorarchaeota archaeon]